jgi:hypothetical protein
MTTSFSTKALRALEREARRLIVGEGVLNDNEVLQSVIALVQQTTGRPRVRGTGRGQWRQVCDYTETAYVLGLYVGTHISDLHRIILTPRRGARS